MRHYDALSHLASARPPSRFNMKIIELGWHLGHGHPEHSRPHKHHEGLVKHKDELLQREDLTPEVRSYIERYVLD